MRQYFYELDGVEHGPVSYIELQQLRLPRDSKVWYQGLGQWVRADKLPAMKEVPLGAARKSVGISTGQPSSFSILDADFDSSGKPQNYLYYAIGLLVLSLITCSIFATIAAVGSLVLSTIVDSKYHGGFFLAAENTSKFTKYGLIATAAWLVFGLAMSGLSFIF